MVSDFHAGEKYNVKLKIGLEKLIEHTSPDFVMIGGDQCLVRNTPEEVREYFCDIIEPILKRNLPWGTVFGNHDRECGIDIAEEQKVYESIPFYLGEAGPEDLNGVGNYRIPVLSSKGDGPAFNLWALDSNRYMRDYIKLFGLDEDTRFILPDHFNDDSGDGQPLFDQIQWYFNGSKELEKEFGKKIPGIMFMHTPLMEFLQILRNPEECGAVGSLRSGIGCSEISSGLFMACLQRGDVKGIFFGHEHLCDISGEYCGITMACDAALGYNMSGHDDLRGGRVIDLFEEGTVQTYQVPLMKLMGKEAMRDPDYFEGGCKYFIRKLK
ncbi:MAG: metallophosphoesterase [Clostridia bacterium]|nr:metallophosphoesterase [Clostridia bacterium]